MNLGDILSGLAAADVGAQTGIQNRRELERRARQELLAEQLQQRQMAMQEAGLGFQRQNADLQRRNIESEIERRQQQTDIERYKLEHPESHIQLPYQFIPPGSAGGAVLRGNRQTGALEPTGLSRAAAPRATAGQAALTQAKAQAGARTAIESIDDAERLSSDPEADVLPTGAALARGAKASGGILGMVGGMAEPLAQKSMTPNQQQFQADMQRMVHSMVGLLPGSRQSTVLFNSLVNAYTPQPGESAQARSAKRAARQRAREWLVAVERGQPVPLPDELAAAGISPADIQAPTESAPIPATPRQPAAPRSAVNPRYWKP